MKNQRTPQKTRKVDWAARLKKFPPVGKGMSKKATEKLWSDLRDEDLREPPKMNAHQVLGNLCGTLDHGTADALEKAIGTVRKKKGKRGTLAELRNPQGS